MEELKNQTHDKVIDRLYDLDRVIAHQFQEVDIDNPTKINEQFFTPGQKICINQERRSLREIKDYLNGNINEIDIRYFVVSREIDELINKCLEHIKETGWVRDINDIKVN